MLYVVGTPIGNLQDISLRQAKTLAESDVILTEDTRSAYILLDFIKSNFKYSIKQEQKVISYYKDREFEKLPEAIDYLNDNLQVSLISESGMPILSDPGYLLVSTCIKKNIPIVVIPGTTAITTGLIYSGFNIKDGFMFVGFLPKKQTEIVKMFKSLKSFKEIFKDLSFVFFESPHRINETLKILQNNWKDVNICVAREMTKTYEEIIRFSANNIPVREYKGEITIVLN